MFKAIRRWFASNTQPVKQPKTYRYEVMHPSWSAPVVIRERNQREARAFVRESLGVTRLPVGTTVERLD